MFAIPKIIGRFTGGFAESDTAISKHGNSLKNFILHLGIVLAQHSARFVSPRRRVLCH